MTMRITLLEVKDYMRVKSARIVPGNKNVIFIAGENENGKTSVLRSMNAALGGKGEEPDNPIRDGADFAEIKVELKDDAEKLGYEVYKRFLKSGSSTLKVVGRDGKVSSPQKVLDRITGGRCLDPLRIYKLKDKEQLEQLLTVVDIGIDLDEWAKTRKKYYDARADANRDVKRHQAGVEANPKPEEIPEAPDTNIGDRVSSLMEAKHKRSIAEGLLDRSRVAYKETEARIANLKKELADAEQAFKDVQVTGKAEKEAFEAMPDVSDELEKAQEEMRTSAQKGEERAKLLAQLQRHNDAKENLAEAEAAAKLQDDNLKTHDQEKADKLANAKMPVDGLEIGEEKLFYKGQPLSQASGAQRLRVSLALAAAMSPELRDIWVEDASLLDDNSLKLVSEFAKERKFCLWLERVGTSDEGAIIIEDGTVKGES